MGARPGLVGGLHGQLRPARHRHPRATDRERSLSARSTPIKLRHLFEDDPRFADLRVSFDTGGMVSTALNNGASSPIDIQIEGGNRRQKP